MPKIDFNNCYICDEQLIGKNSSTLKINFPLIWESDSLKYKPFHHCLLCYNFEAIVDESNNLIIMEVTFNNGDDIDIDSIVEKK